MNGNSTAEATVTINAASADVWNALVTPEAIRQYMFGTDVHTDWKEGSPITWDNNATENARAHSEKNWSMMLSALKKFVEGS